MPDFIVIDELSNKIDQSENDIKDSLKDTENKLQSLPWQIKYESGWAFGPIKQLHKNLVNLPIRTGRYSASSQTFYSKYVWDQKRDKMYSFETYVDNTSLASSGWDNALRSSFIVSYLSNGSSKFVNCPYLNLDGSAFVPTDDAIYFIGGYKRVSSNANYSYLNTNVAKFDYETETWTKVGTTNFPWVVANSTYANSAFGLLYYTYYRPNKYYSLNGKMYLIEYDSSNYISLYCCNTIGETDFKWKKISTLSSTNMTASIYNVFTTRPIHNLGRSNRLPENSQLSHFSRVGDDLYCFIISNHRSNFNGALGFKVNTITDSVETLSMAQSNNLYYAAAVNYTTPNTAYYFLNENQEMLVSNVTNQDYCGPVKLYETGGLGYRESLSNYSYLPSSLITGNACIAPIWVSNGSIYGFYVTSGYNSNTAANITNGFANARGYITIFDIPEKEEYIYSGERTLLGAEKSEGTVFQESTKYDEIKKKKTYDPSIVDYFPLKKDAKITFVYNVNGGKE